LYADLDRFWDQVEERFSCEIYASKLIDSQQENTLAYIGIKNVSQDLIESLNRRCPKFNNNILTFKRKAKSDDPSAHAQEQPSTQVREPVREQASEQIQERDTYVRRSEEQQERIERLEDHVEVLTAQVEGLTAQVETLQRELTRAINVIQENANHAENQINEMVEWSRPQEN
jgi:predicted RNase H-like nuclease (RuvC/YqgF family)